MKLYNTGEALWMVTANKPHNCTPFVPLKTKHYSKIIGSQEEFLSKGVT